MNCSVDEAVALLTKWKSESSPVLIMLGGTVGLARGGETESFADLPLFEMSSLAVIESCSPSGVTISWPPRGKLQLFFIMGVSFDYSEPRNIPAEIKSLAGRKLLGALQVLMPFGSQCAICEVSES